MAMPTDIGVIDTMLDLPYANRDWSSQFGDRLRDDDSRNQRFIHPAGFLFKDPPQVERGPDAIGDTLREMDDAALDAQADALLAQRYAEIVPSTAPFIMAALQVVWTDLASRLDVRDVPYVDAPGVCPVCGGAPVASVVRIGGALQGYRYVQCGLCSTEAHVVRVKCTNCDSTKGIAYHGIEGGSEAVKI